ncbi:lipase class 2 [Actinobacteria bacterium OV450]|nr:lipase class 2 [Actinobacteria bacterium OV450]
MKARKLTGPLATAAILAAVTTVLALPGAVPAAATTPSSGRAAAATAAAGRAAAPVPRFDDFAGAFIYSLANPQAFPQGVNDFSCKPSTAHPAPVVLVHGTAADALSSFGRLAPVLKDAGYCVFAGNFGDTNGTGVKALRAVPKTAEEVAAFVDMVRAATGKDKVDMVGYSQGGGLLPRWYLKYEGGAAKVDRLIGISPSNHGTSASGLATLGQALNVIQPIADITNAQSLQDQTQCSSVNVALDESGDIVPGVRYTTIVTDQDMVVTPYDNQYLRDNKNAPRTRCHNTTPDLTPAEIAKPDGNAIVHPADGPITNIRLQDVCPTDLSGHLRSPYSPAVGGLVLNALDPEHATRVPCTTVPPLGSLG